MLVSRYWLRAQPSGRALYGHTKWDLAAQEWKYVQNYADAKTELIEQIIARAKMVGRPDAA